MGGLGDVCLSESLFYSLFLYFGKKITALGIKRYLSIFSQYFHRIENIESLKWLFLFSKETKDLMWERIVLVGKDRERTLRERWQRYSREDILFVDMYPDDERIHVEDYQLRQLTMLGIKGDKREVVPNIRPLIILYPEKSIRKMKLDYEKFVEVEERLRKRQIPTLWLKQKEIVTPNCDAVEIEDLIELKEFFESKGGIFVSNDSGVAHLAGSCGLYTVTIFFDADPIVWHPRGKNKSLSLVEDRIDPDKLERTILDIFFTFFPRS